MTTPGQALPPPLSSVLGAAQPKIWPWGGAPLRTGDAGACPKVTIVTPSYNQGEYLEETIRSVLLQDYPNIEYFVMDGGSSDRSADILRYYAPWLAGWVSEKDRGQADAINQGWARSSGEFLGWLNSDDVLTPGSVSSIMRHFTAHPEVDFVYGDLEYIDRQSRFLRRVGARDFDLRRIIRDADYITQPGSLFRRGLFERTGNLDASFHFLMDLDYWVRAGATGKFSYLRQPVARFRHHPASKSSQQTNLAAEEITRVYQKFYARPDLDPYFTRISRQAWSSVHFYSAQSWYTGGSFRSAYREIWRALKLNPLCIFQSARLLFLTKLLILSAMGGRSSPLFRRLRQVE